MELPSSLRTRDGSILAPPWPAYQKGSAASYINRVPGSAGMPFAPGTEPIFAPFDTAFKETWTLGTFKSAISSPGATARPSTTSTFRESFSLPLRSPPSKIDRSIIGWPDPHAAQVRPFMGKDNLYGTPLSYCGTPRGVWGEKHELK